MIIFLVFFNHLLISQSADTTKMYREAIEFIDKKRDTLKQFWANELTYKKDKNKFLKQDFNFCLSKFICFKSPVQFPKYFQDISEISIDTNRVASFEPYESDLIKSSKFYDTIPKSSGSVFVVNFSKPVNNFLLGEISLSQIKLLRCSNKFQAETIRLIFIYDETQNLLRVHLGKIIYQ